MLTTLAYWIPWQLRGESKVGDSDWVPVSKPRWPIESRFCEDKFSNVKKTGYDHSSTKGVVAVKISIERATNHSWFIARRPRKTVNLWQQWASRSKRFAFVDGKPRHKAGPRKLVYRLIHLFSSTEIFSKRRKICSCWRKTRATDHALDLTLSSNWPANAHGTQYQLSPATTHASSHCQRPHQTPSGDRSLTLFASTV